MGLGAAALPTLGETLAWDHRLLMCDRPADPWQLVPKWGLPWVMELRDGAKGRLWVGKKGLGVWLGGHPWLCPSGEACWGLAQGRRREDSLRASHVGK